AQDRLGVAEHRGGRGDAAAERQRHRGYARQGPKSASGGINFYKIIQYDKPEFHGGPGFWLGLDELSDCLARPILYHSLPVGVGGGKQASKRSLIVPLARPD